MNRIYSITIPTAAVVAGIVFFLLYNNWITISAPGFRKNQQVHVAYCQKKSIMLWYWQNHDLKREKKEIFWSDSIAAQCTSLIESWLNILDEEGILHKQCTLQSVSLTQHNQELLISFDMSPLETEGGTYDNLMLVQSLLKTLREAAIPVQAVRFLVHHQEMLDRHLDFSRPWPMQGFIPQSEECKKQSTQGKRDRDLVTIMLDPAGDAQRTGRVISDTFERSVTLHYAEKLKALLEAEFSGGSPAIRVILTRVPGETIDALQNASFANRLDVDLYVSINFYQESSVELRLNLYYVLYHPVSDFWFNQNTSSSWIHYNQAHLLSAKKSCNAAYQLAGKLKTHARPSGFTVKEPIGLPFRPLIGITSPALALEAGLKNKDDAQKLVAPVAQALYALIKD